MSKATWVGGVAAGLAAGALAVVGLKLWPTKSTAVDYRPNPGTTVGPSGTSWVISPLSSPALNPDETGVYLVEAEVGTKWEDPAAMPNWPAVATKRIPVLHFVQKTWGERQQLPPIAQMRSGSSELESRAQTDLGIMPVRA